MDPYLLTVRGASVPRLKICLSAHALGKRERENIKEGKGTKYYKTSIRTVIFEPRWEGKERGKGGY